MIRAILLLALNFILYFFFGALPLGILKKRFSIAMSVFTGFFLYYSIFTLFAVPITYRWRPLSMLSKIWAVVVVVIILAALIFSGKWIFKGIKVAISQLGDNWKMLLYIGLLVLVEIIIVLYSYQFTLDAAYYVANVTTSVQTNSLNIYDPFTGDWQDHFEMRYFFATYPLQDAVICFLTGTAPLIQTKLVMAATVIILTNLLYYMIGVEILDSSKKSNVFCMMFFAGLINFFFISIYTSSNFLMTRTYEGKSILGNVILPGILYLAIRMWKKIDTGESDLSQWLLLFLVCFGSTVISNSSNMLVPATLFIVLIPMGVMHIAKRNYVSAVVLFVKMGICMLPGIVLTLVYVAYVRGMFVLFTYPR